MNEKLILLYRERKKCEYDLYRDKRKKHILYPISYLHKINAMIEHELSTQRAQSTGNTSTQSTDSTESTESTEREHTA
jgi:hypothetical protein